MYGMTISRYVAGIGIMTLTGAPALAQGVGATPPRSGGPVVPRTASPRNDPAATTPPAAPSGVRGSARTHLDDAALSLSSRALAR
jgi:hypothetical protein